MITYALPKGRLAEETALLFEKAGVDCSVLKSDTRKLVLCDKKGESEFILVKPSDVPIYVERGVADVGVCGKDVLLEEGKDLYEMADLHIGNCDFCIAGKNEIDYSKGKITVATKYPRIAREYFESKNADVEIVKLNGSVELAAVISLADVIADIVQTGATLRENGLRVLEKVCSVSARLIVNKVSLKIKSAEILPLIEKIKRVGGVG